MARVLVTGANRGIGLEFCRQYHLRGDYVLAACREPSADLAALDVRVIPGVDVASDSDVAKLAADLDGHPIDTLINNAGVLSHETLEDLDLDRMRKQFEINTLGPLRVTRALLPNLEAADSPRIGILTSLMGSCADNGSGGYYGYRVSKAGVNAAGVSLARDLASRNIPVVLLHPGMVATAMTGGVGIDVEPSVTGLISRLDGLTMEQSGTFWHTDGRELPW